MTKLFCAIISSGMSKTAHQCAEHFDPSFFIQELFGERFEDLMERELRFALVVNWLLCLLKKSTKAGQLHAVLDALLTAEDKAGVWKFRRIYRRLFLL
jgi:hypothetical protein